MKSLRLVPVLFLTSLLAAVPALAVNRTLTVTAPAVIKPGADINVVITATTDAADGEQIGFLHAEHSIDGGKTWLPVYAEKLGRTVKRTVNVRAGADGTRALVRVRAAFRGGKAGDVDFTGKPIAWDTSWDKWQSPPAQTATTSVKAR